VPPAVPRFVLQALERAEATTRPSPGSEPVMSGTGAGRQVEPGDEAELVEGPAKPGIITAAPRNVP
jgi:hypothetical protein